MMDYLTEGESGYMVVCHNVISAAKIERVIYSKTTTIVFWSDRTKTIVRKGKNEPYDKEKAILWAYFIKNNNKTKTQSKKEMEGYLNA